MQEKRGKNNMKEGATHKIPNEPKVGEASVIHSGFVKTNPIDRLSLSFRPPRWNPVCQNKANFHHFQARKSDAQKNKPKLSCKSC
jgi:hypothetical protein